MYDADQLSAILTGHGLTAVPDGTGVFIAVAADTEIWLWATANGWELGYATSSPTSPDGAHMLVASDVPDAMVVAFALALIAELENRIGPEVTFDLRNEAGGLAALKWLTLHIDKPITVALAFTNGTPFYTWDLTEAHAAYVTISRHQDGFVLKVKPWNEPSLSLTGTIVCCSYLNQKEGQPDA
ncbi:hypothetical protein [Nonomuraea endophytica]|uniref:Uncharacterized protein n=1 Tax=Nonomuraea endophytica TaxID=714136 RepID=A0A7W8EJ57_9ACTN|nr:hypothetical protein [Nonomuraea endophytica]MBB5081294.1 hypothetical protein [Nonomuraea endophytica]